jgi:hypothetical protein
LWPDPLGWPANHIEPGGGHTTPEVLRGGASIFGEFEGGLGTFNSR